MKGKGSARLRPKSNTRAGDISSWNKSIEHTDCSIYLNEKRPKVKIPRNKQRTRQKNFSVNQTSEIPNFAIYGKIPDFISPYNNPRA